MLPSEPLHAGTRKPSTLARHGVPSTLEMAFIENAGAPPAVGRRPPSPPLPPAPWASGHSGQEPRTTISTASLLNAHRGKTGHTLTLVFASAAVCAIIWAMVFVAAMNTGGGLQGMHTEAAEKEAEARLPLEYIAGPSERESLSDQGNAGGRQPNFEVGGRQSSRSSSRSRRSKTTAYYKNLDDVREWTIDTTDGNSDGSVTSWTSEDEYTASTRPFAKLAHRRGTHKRRSRTPFRHSTKSHRRARVHTQRHALTKQIDDVDSALALTPE
ncbi:uncharacterized protein LOC144123534 [Amblyomma americanum]